MAEQYNRHRMRKDAKGVLIGNWVEDFALRESSNASNLHRVIGGTHVGHDHSTMHDEFRTPNRQGDGGNNTYRRANRDFTRIMKEAVEESEATKKDQAKQFSMFEDRTSTEKPSQQGGPRSDADIFKVYGETPITLYSEAVHRGIYYIGVTQLGGNISFGKNSIRSQPIHEYIRGATAYE